MNVPLLDLKAQYVGEMREQIRAAIDEVCDAQWFVMGPNVSDLEAEIAAYTGAKHAIGCASGSDALLLALMGLDIGCNGGENGRVICPSYTFFATGGSTARLGAVPVYVDIDPVTYNMDPEKVREVAKRTPNLAAIMPVHLFGQCVDMDAYRAIADEFGVPLIEDAAQAIGSKDHKGRMAGTVGDIGCFSFFPSKNLGGFGDGGIITTNDDALAEKLAVLRIHGGKPKYYHSMIGVNSRLDALQAAVLRVKLRYLEGWHAGRIANADFYDDAFLEAGAATTATPLGEPADLALRIPERPAAPARHIYNQYVIRVPAEHRDALREHMSTAKIGTEIYYPVPLHMQECFAYLGQPEGDLPESEAAARETIALPIYAELAVEQKRHVVDTVVGYLRRHATKAKAAAGTR
ncbi:MAG: DegT/DnrJ/EryC1/StrS family aminotransferase [Phycisphaeraceae bacterium]|nr:MAG: DegT/DnrJ/EryC1/StrS family aminotransferase [Phycisphaeraceae bacterium]